MPVLVQSITQHRHEDRLYLSFRLYMVQSLLCLYARALASPGTRAGVLCRKGPWQASWSGPFAEILLEARRSVKEREPCKGDDSVPISISMWFFF